MIELSGRSLAMVAPIFFGILAAGCRSLQPSIVFTKVPAAGEGSPYRLDAIEGRVTGGKSGQQIVLFAKAGVWWVQPLSAQPFTAVRPDSTWSNLTHPGTEYAALLVASGFVPPVTTQDLPHAGGAVIAVSTVKGAGYPAAPPPRKVLRFSGYDWDVRSQPSDRGGRPNSYDLSNAWTDAEGFLHLHAVQQGDNWIGAEVSLTHSLGQGLYLFTVRDVSHLDPAAAMTLCTWDDLGTDQHHREVDIEVSRWGDPASKNAQYVVQPFDEPANVVRFEAPAGPLTYSFHWEPGRVSFKTVRDSRLVAAHEFTSGVPSPGGELVKINLYVFPKSQIPARRPSEVIVEKFEYLP
jgi:hypothetical protein